MEMEAWRQTATLTIADSMGNRRCKRNLQSQSRSNGVPTSNEQWRWRCSADGVSMRVHERPSLGNNSLEVL